MTLEDIKNNIEAYIDSDTKLGTVELLNEAILLLSEAIAEERESMIEELQAEYQREATLRYRYYESQLMPRT